ncbi:tetratricopeptide repeat protein [Haloactinospora alba]|uniref:tetratricopeptide repeat protein n=1 Tax=Haloactinospora alba TaxID=405555 RepID=UPI00147684D7|nr:tetratricopeptide repeat protein [Haloactinospora alba]
MQNTTTDSNGVVVQVRDVHGDLHIASSPNGHGSRTPRQVPPLPPHFVDRQEVLGTITQLTHRAHSKGQPALVVLSGIGGIGKTALATTAAHALSEHHPDGQVFLRGGGTSAPVEPGTLLGRGLTALGHAPTDLPRDTEARIGMWRSATAQQRLLVLLDDAATAEQVRCLLPGSGGHTVLATARSRLSPMARDGAAFIDLHPLEDSAAHSLIARLADHAGEGDPAAVSRVAGACHRVPLALVVTASTATRTRASLAEVADRLTALPTFALEASVTEALTTAYRTLSGQARGLYRALACHPPYPWDAPAAAALTGLPLEDAQQALGELVETNLLDQPHLGWYAMHDVVRSHASSLVGAEAATARERLRLHYLTTAIAYDRRINPYRWRILPAALVDQAPEVEATATTALTWFHDRAGTIGELIDEAHTAGHHATAVYLCEALWGYYTHHKPLDTWQATHTAGLAAARATGDAVLQARMLQALGTWAMNSGDADTAHRNYTQARELWVQAEHILGQASVTEALGTVNLTTGNPHQAQQCYREALSLHEHLEQPRGVALARRYLGQAARELHDYGRALELLSMALEWFADNDDSYMVVRCRLQLATTHLYRGDLDEAHTTARSALELATDLDARYEVASCHALLADVAQALTLNHLHAAHTIAHATGAHEWSEALAKQKREVQDTRRNI